MQHIYISYNATATTAIYTLSLHDALPILGMRSVDHLDSSAAANLQCLNKPRHHLASRWRLQATTRRNEVVLHIHDNHRGLGGFDSRDFHHCFPLIESVWSIGLLMGSSSDQIATERSVPSSKSPPSNSLTRS